MILPNRALAKVVRSGMKTALAQVTIVSEELQMTMTNKDISQVLTEEAIGFIDFFKRSINRNILSMPGPYTVFAPVDQVFSNLPVGLKFKTKSDQSIADKLFNTHIVIGYYLEKDLAKMDVLMNLNNDSLSIAKCNSSVTIQHACLIKSDIECINGIVHLIDNLLFPPHL